MSEGRIIAGKYRLLHEVGHGGMGSVWAADHLTLRSPVALKLINPNYVCSPEARRRFEQEALAAAALRSRHVVQVLDYDFYEGAPYLVMELLKGESLATRLSKTRLSPQAIWTVMSHMASAIGFAHSLQFVHRDLKPSNVFLEDGDDLWAKILDFGVMRTLTAHTTPFTTAGALLGTPHYMSPEQALGENIDARSDLWGMGVIAFECLTRQRPFDGSSVHAVFDAICKNPIVVPSRVARVPAGFDAWFGRAVARNRDRRFQTAKELADELAPLLAQDASEWVGVARAETTSIQHDGETEHGQPAKIRTERRRELRRPSKIPIAIDRRRDMRHIALLHNVSRSGALLLTRQPYLTEQRIVLSLHPEGPEQDEVVEARVVRVSASSNVIWKVQVGVRFTEPLPDDLVARLER